MKRLVGALLLCASTALGQATNGWAEIANGWGEIQTPPGYSTIPAPTGCTSGLVPYFNSSLQLVCSPTAYAPATDTTTSTGTISARNLTATALATPAITPPVANVLTKLTTLTVVAGADLVDGDYFTLSDGSAVVYEFDSAPAGVTAGRVAITFTGAESAQGIRDLVVVAINGSTLAAQAIAAAADTLTVTLDVAGAAGGVNSENVANAGFLVPVWGDPTHATTYGYKVVAFLNDGTGAPSAEVTTATGHAQLDNHNYNSVTWGVVTGAAYYKLYRTTGTPSGGDAPPRLLYTGTLLTFADTNATSTSEAVATSNTTGRVLGKVPGVGGTLKVCASNALNTTGCDYVADGTADQVEIQAAINALPATGGSVVLSDGTFDMRYPVQMRSGLWLHGVGPGTILKLNKANWYDLAHETYMLSDGVGHTGGTQSNITISDLTIDHDSYNGSFYINPIVFWGYSALATNNRVERCVIKNGKGYAILTIYNENLHVLDNTITGWGDSCVELRSTRGAVMSGNTFETCSLQTYADSTYAIATGGIVYDHNILKNVGVYVADPLDGKKVDGYAFTNNSWRIVGDVRVNIWFNSTKNLRIDNNILDTSLSTKDTQNALIHIPAATVDVASIRGNTIVVATDAGAGVTGRGAILVAGATNVSIEDNHILAPGSTTAYGVKATSGSVRVRRNRIVGVGAGASTVAIDIAGTASASVSDNILDTWARGLSIAATASGSRAFDNAFATVATPYSILDTTTLFREQTGLAFADLPADVADGSLVYCTDCTIASPCAGSGTGALAKRLANAWVCD